MSHRAVPTLTLRRQGSPTEGGEEPVTKTLNYIAHNLHTRKQLTENKTKKTLEDSSFFFFFKQTQHNSCQLKHQFNITLKEG